MSDDFQLLKHGVDSPTKFEVEIHKSNGDLLFTRDEMIRSLKAINIPQFNDETLDAFVNNNYIFARGRPTIFQIQITFKNINSMSLYQTCLKHMHDNMSKYPAEQYFTIHVKYTGTYKNDNKSKSITFTKCMMTNLSDLTFDYSSVNNTMDFSIGFKSGNMSMS